MREKAWCEQKKEALTVGMLSFYTLSNSLCADIVAGVVTRAELVRHNGLDAAACVDDRIVANVHGAVADRVGRIGEEDQIARLQILLGNMLATIIILCSRTIDTSLNLPVAFRRRMDASASSILR